MSTFFLVSNGTKSVANEAAQESLTGDKGPVLDSGQTVVTMEIVSNDNAATAKRKPASKSTLCHIL